MHKFSRRYRELLDQVTQQVYAPIDAIQLLKKLSNARFVETAEMHVSLGIDPKYPDQQLRATVTLPKGTGKFIKVAVLSRGERVSEALLAGADIAGSEDLIDEILKGRLAFDKLIATPDIMPSIAKLGRVLGPKGLMPSPKAGTVTNSLIESISDFKAGKIEYRVDRSGIIHLPFGKVDFSLHDLVMNLLAVRDSIDKNRPSGSKGKYWKSVYISSTMGPSIPIDIDLLRECK
uniref:Ribosomal protein n=1 Tax=Rhodogorgon sp. TaxID=2485824 RepID=A0A3G3MHT9_9FLOR|nr:ribosomal protein L1 [Rhodogorgon sp.]